MKKQGWITGVVVSLTISSLGWGYSLEDYQNDVKKNHAGYRGSMQKSAGAKTRSIEGTLPFAPMAFSEVNHTDDRRPTVASAFQGVQTLIDKASVGVSLQARMGLLSKLSYNVQRTAINGVDPNLVPTNRFYDSYVGFELSQPLWKNAMGRQFQLQEEAAEASALANSYNERYSAIQIIMQAELRYWRLALTSEIVRLQQESYERSLKIRQWQAGRAQKGLADEADLLQANAALKMRELDLKAAQNDQRLALKAFNEFRGRPATEAQPGIKLPSSKDVETYSIPQRAKERNDVIAARMNLKVTESNIEVSRDQQLPSLDFIGNASLYGRDPEFSDSASRSLSMRNPLYTIGIRFNMPLGGTETVRAGYLQERQGAELALQQKIQDQNNEWNDLTHQFEDGKERLRISLDLERAQKIKLDAERERHRQGRSTTYQIFLFEQDYLMAQLSRVQTLIQVLNVHAQMKTFQGGHR